MATVDQYDPQAVERKWQAVWAAGGVNSLTRDDLAAAREPYFNLMMFPYPSAEGLHIGNIYAYTGADVNGRFWRLRGRTVFEPIGFDAFGIHSENYALSVGTHPSDLIPRNVANFTRQLRRMGGMFDWGHVVDTTDPRYYRWTQWLFLKLFHAGLVERREAPVNWCPSCGTVVANEQVVGGRCERCDGKVEQRLLLQWFLRITAYAQRLLDGLASLDWSAPTRKAQENWIGRSEGAELDFAVVGHEATVRVYTTRPETVFGATYVVLAPEHPLVARIVADAEREAVTAYCDAVAGRDLVERRKTDGRKNGVFIGAYCINPATDQGIPVWIADYALMDYGTGAVMAVPAHDRRDLDFAQRFGLPLVRVVKPPSAAAHESVAAAWEGDGTLVNSGRFDGMTTAKAKHAVTEWLAGRGLGEARTHYRLRDWCVSRQRYWGPPIPVVHCDGCGIVAVPESELPVLLPRLADFRPDAAPPSPGGGVGPLGRARDWYETQCPRCGGAARRETDVSDTFLDSAWYFLRYPSVDRDDVAFDPALTRRWLPVDCYIGGHEHAVLHLLYARFMTMALNDLGLLDFEEPFERFRAHGLIIREGAKMSKSRGNVLVPDDIIEEQGADALRLYLMFMGPFEQGGDYRPQGIHGPRGFLVRLWQSVLEAEDGPVDENVERQLHRTIEQVTRQIPEQQYNTAIAAMMGYLNEVRSGGRVPRRAELAPLVVMVAPFAPHIAEELHERLGHAGGLFANGCWPAFDPGKTESDDIEIAVQVDGRLRARLKVPAEADEDSVREQALADPNVARHLAGRRLATVVYVPGRLVNLVST